MNGDSRSETTATSSSHFAGWIHFSVISFFLVAAVLVAAKLSAAFPILEKSDWPEALLLFTATAAVIDSVSRTLPFQNVVWGALVIGIVGGVAQAIGTLALIPFGPYVYTSAAGPRIFGVLPWMVPLVWIVFIYSSRGVARLILQPRRWTQYYGFWLIGLAAVLSVILNCSFDPWASRQKHYWIWELTRFPYAWKGTPLTNFAGWLATSVVAMAFVTPMLINKKPGAAPAREFGTLLVWLSLNGLFVVAMLKTTPAR